MRNTKYRCKLFSFIRMLLNIRESAFKRLSQKILALAKRQGKSILNTDPVAATPRSPLTAKFTST